MKVAKFQIRCVSVPLAEPHRTASGVVAASPLVLLTVTTDAGVHYFGSATVVRTMNQPKDLVVTLTFAGLGTETPTTESTEAL